MQIAYNTIYVHEKVGELSAQWWLSQCKEGEQVAHRVRYDT